MAIGIALVFNLLDFLTGTVAAVKSSTIKSSKMRDGLFKKVGFVLLYVVVYIIDHYGNTIGINTGGIAVPAICLYVVTTELISIAENLYVLNPAIVTKKLLTIIGVKNVEENKND